MASLKEYEMLGEIGRGAFGVVYKVRHKQDNQIYVLKQVDISKLDLRSKKQAQTEANILKQIRSPYIVRYYQSFLEKGNLNIVMEFCSGGDLQRYLKRMMGRPLKEQLIWKFFVEMCIGVKDIHLKRVLHRDIKAMNIFLTQDQNIRIGDLGVAKEMKQDFALTKVGTPYYLSPEMCEEKPYNEKTDIWALGCVLYQLCTGKYPFEAENLPSLMLRIVKGKYPPIPNNYSLDLSQMVRQCLSVDHKRRPSALHILQKPFIKEFIKTKGIQTSAEKVFEHERPAIIGNTAPLVVKKTTPPKQRATNINFRPAQVYQQKGEALDDANIVESIKVGKWNKPSKPEIEPNNHVPQFLKKKLSEPLIVLPPEAPKKPAVPKKIDPVPYPIGILQSPSNKAIPKSPQHMVQHPLKDPKQQRRAKQEQRKLELKLEQEKHELKIKEFQKKKEQQRKEKARQAELKKKQQQRRLKQLRNDKSKPELGSPTSGKLQHVEELAVDGHHRGASEPPKYIHSPSDKSTKHQPSLGNIVEDHIPDDPDSDEERIKETHKPDKLRGVVHLVQQSLADDEVWDDFGIIGQKPKPSREPNVEGSSQLELKNVKPLQWDSAPQGQVRPTSILPTFQQAEPEGMAQTIVCQYDPNEIMEQLDEVQPYESSIEQEVGQDAEKYLEDDEQLQKDRQNLQKMLEENLKRREVLLTLIKQKQEQLMIKFSREQYEKLKTVTNEGEEREVQQAFRAVKAFEDQKILQIFYKILLDDSKLAACDRTIKQITARLHSQK